MIKTISIVILMLAISVLIGQTEPEVIWNRTYSLGSSTGFCTVNCDGGYAITGFTMNNNEQKILLLKTDLDGHETWSHEYNLGNNEAGHSLINTSDGGVAIVGRVDNYDILVKTDSLGSIEWSESYYQGVDHSICQLEDGTFITSGTRPSPSETKILHISSSGDLISDNSVYNYSCGVGLSQTSDGIIVSTGIASNGDDYDMALIKHEIDGDTLWTRLIGDIGSQEGNSLSVTYNGDYIVTGRTEYPSNGGNDLLLTLISSNGEMIWSRNFGGAQFDNGNSVIQTFDGGFIACGYHNGNESYILRTNNSGYELWSKTVFGFYPAYSIIQNPDGSYITTGASSSGVKLIKLAADVSLDFLAIPTETFINQPVQFEDQSTPVFSEWQWDFQNDGIYDSFEQNPSYTYTQPGTYSVKLKVSSKTMVDSLVKVDYITVTYVPPKPPENVEIVMVGNDAHIEWDAVTENIYGNPITPDYYFVYYNGSDNVDGEYYFHGLTTDTEYLHANVGLAECTMFYRVESVVILDRSQNVSLLRRGMDEREVDEIMGFQTLPIPLSSSE